MYGIKHASGLVDNIQRGEAAATAQRDGQYPDSEVIEVNTGDWGINSHIKSIGIENGKHRLGPHTALIDAQARKANLRAQADNALRRAEYQRMRATASADDKAAIDELIAELR